MKRIRSKKHIDFIHQLPCVITKQYGVEAAHIRYNDLNYGKTNPGIGRKPDDCWTVPLCPEKHREQHSMNERKFWDNHGIDPLKIALALWKVSGDVARGDNIIYGVRP